MKVDLIKIDIESFEFHALCGSVSSIARWLPKLQICIYHKADDFFARYLR
jgi:hypothetical protein